MLKFLLKLLAWVGAIAAALAALAYFCLLYTSRCV